MKPIVKTPNPILTAPTRRVIKIDTKTKQTIADLTDTLEAASDPKGVGLASTQIGKSLRLFVTKPTKESQVRVFINPHFVALSDDLLKGIPDEKFKLEGCLSIPNVWGMVNRHKWVTVEFTDEKGHEHEETFSGFEAIIIQHEMDHLDGIMFPKRVLEQKGRLYKIAHDDKGEETLEPLDI